MNCYSVSLCENESTQKGTKNFPLMSLVKVNHVGHLHWILSPGVWPGFDCRPWRHMWVKFAVGSLLAPRVFSPSTPVFPSL